MGAQHENTALLVMDMQTAILNNLPETTALKSNVAKAIAAARDAKIPVIYVVVGFRPGMQEISPRNKTFSASKARMSGGDMNAFMAIDPSVAPQQDDLVVTKRRVSAFAGSDLEVVLRALDVKALVLTGVSSSGVVLSTTREAADKDFGLTILSDCCADGDEEVHRVLMTKVFARQADVLTVDEWSKR